MDGRTDTDGWMDGRMDGGMDGHGWMDRHGWMDGWTDGKSTGIGKLARYRNVQFYQKKDFKTGNLCAVRHTVNDDVSISIGAILHYLINCHYKMIHCQDCR